MRVFLVVLNICLAMSEGDEDLVVELTDLTFTSTVSDTRYLMVEFYAPWCGHCQSFYPQYSQAAKTLSDTKSQVKLAKLDATTQKETAEAFDIQGFPAFKFFRNGRPIDYTGERSAEGMVEWINKKISTGITEITKPGELQYISEEEDAFVVAYTSRDSEVFTVLKEVQNEFEDVKFFIVSEPELMKEYHQREGTIMIMKTFDDKNSYFKETLTKEKLTTFIQRELIPLVVEFSQENAAQIFDSPIQKHFIFMSDSKDTEHRDRMRDLRTLAREYKEDFIVIHCNVGNNQHQDVIQYFGFKMSDIPSFIIFELETNAKYRPNIEGSNDISIRELRRFMIDYTEGKIERFVVSAPLPSDWNDHPVAELVGSNFASVVRDPNKDVLVLVYAPWCGQCKSLAPVWEKLAEDYKDREDLRLAKFDGTANDLDSGEEVDDFPSIILYRKNDNEEIDYTGKRDYESLAKFIETGKFEPYQHEEVEENDGFGIEDFEDEEFSDEKDGKEEDLLEETKGKNHDEL